ncbi:orotidine-5'-phosphate decarboxylase [Candidatus Margulisiibacteriota bacterium]
MKFFDKLKQASRENNSFLCVGLDPVLEKIPAVFHKSENPIFDFNKAIIDATVAHVCAYKPNAAFYEQYGLPGIEALHKTIDYISGKVPVILDVKRSDIGNTAAAYAKAAFELFKADAVTVNPLMGRDSIEPFSKYEDKGVFVLGLTSNQGAEDFQKMIIDQNNEQRPLYLHIAQKVKEWDVFDNCGLVVGATNGGEIAEIRGVVPDKWFLIPGIGAQGGDLASVLKSAVSKVSEPKIIINASRSVLYAGSDDDFTTASQMAAIELKNELNKRLAELTLH